MSNENRTVYLVDFNSVKVDIENGAILQFSFGKSLPKKLTLIIQPSPIDSNSINNSTPAEFNSNPTTR